jgi:catechol 2,3-dioxygenase
MASAQQDITKPVFFRPRRLGHANLFVRELERTMDFYKNVVGLEQVYMRLPIRAGFLSNGNTHHDIGVVEYSGPAGWKKEPGLNHIGIEVDNERELVEGFRRARAANIEFKRTIDHEIARSLYLNDPDGNSIEIYADTTKNWRTERTGLVQNPTYKWTPGEPPPSPEPKFHPNPEIRRVEHAIFHPRRTTHVVLVENDYAGAFRHFTDIVGFRPLLGDADTAYCVLAGTCGERSVSLFRARPGRPPGLHHVGLQVVDEADLLESKRRARDAGIEVEVDIDHAARHAIFVRDPDGIRLQFYCDRAERLEPLHNIEEDIALYLA